MKSIGSFYLMVSLVAFGQNYPPERLITFEWKYNAWLHGTLLVPSGYKEETENYREGIVTYLHYPGSSYIILQHGGMFQVPMLQGKEYLVAETKDLADRIVRRGRIKNTDLFWGEINMKRKKVTGRKAGFFDFYPPNIGFNRVSKEHRELFNRALESFVGVEYPHNVTSNKLVKANLPRLALTYYKNARK